MTYCIVSKLLHRFKLSHVVIRLTSSDTVSFRLNSCFLSLSRRAADRAIANGRVSKNGNRVKDLGERVIKGDRLSLDGETVEWEDFKLRMQKEPLKETTHQQLQSSQSFIYLKIWKPLGTICSTKGHSSCDSLITSLVPFEKHRLFPVGRLDKESSGIVLLTNDSRLMNLLGKNNNCPKQYLVTTNRRISDADLQMFRQGVTITTTSSSKILTGKTLPCEVYRNKDQGDLLKVVLREGRNRQVRRVLETLGYSIRSLHRESFAGITLTDIENPGSWKPLVTEEIDRISSFLL